MALLATVLPKLSVWDLMPCQGRGAHSAMISAAKPVTWGVAERTIVMLKLLDNFRRCFFRTEGALGDDQSSGTRDVGGGHTGACHANVGASDAEAEHLQGPSTGLRRLLQIFLPTLNVDTTTLCNQLPYAMDNLQQICINIAKT